MPLRKRGSVSARFSVRFSTVRTRRKLSRSAEKTSMPPGSSACKRLFICDDLERCSSLRARFGQHQRAVGKIEGREILPPTEFRSHRTPVQPAGDHQVQHHPEAVVEAESDALANAAQFAHRVSFDGRQRRLDRAQQEWAGDAHARQRLADNASSQRAKIGFNVGKLRHRYQIALLHAALASGGLRGENSIGSVRNFAAQFRRILAPETGKYRQDKGLAG